MDWLESLVLGVVQGVTEFLPISSDGHLLITQHAFAWWKGPARSGAENLFFNVMLHVGTLAAIVIYYRAVARTGARGLLGATDVAPAYRRGSVVRTGLLACLATLPLVPDALFFKKLLERSQESLTAAGVGFLITSALLLSTLRARATADGKGPSEMTWLDALLIGLAQMFAPLPGVSRSGLTVAAALGLGFSRAWAVGFSLLIAVPAILGAVVFEIKDLNVATLATDRVLQTVAATVVAGLVGYGAIIWLVRIVRAGRLWYFSVYLILLAAAVLTVAALSGGGPRDAPPTQALDRPLRSGDAGPRVEGGPGRAVGPLDRALGAGARTGLSGTGRPSRSGRDAGLVLGRPVAGRGRCRV